MIPLWLREAIEHEIAKRMPRAADITDAVLTNYGDPADCDFCLLYGRPGVERLVAELLPRVGPSLETTAMEVLSENGQRVTDILTWMEKPAALAATDELARKVHERMPHVPLEACVDAVHDEIAALKRQAAT